MNYVNVDIIQAIPRVIFLNVIESFLHHICFVFFNACFSPDRILDI